MSSKSKILRILLVLVVVGTAIGIGGALSCDRFPRLGQGPSLIDEAWSEILSNYVEQDAIDTTSLSYGAIEGIVEALDDPYSFFMTPEEYEAYTSSFQGEFEGIGAYVSVNDEDLIVVTELIENSPAEKAGILAGDIIVEIEGESVADMTFTEALLKIRGPEGTSVDLLVSREGLEEPFTVSITRARVEVPSVILELFGNYAHITITGFNDRTGEEMAEILDSLAQDVTGGIILDVRGNPGGTVTTVIEVVSHFISDGAVLDIRDNKGEINTFDRVEVTPLITLPVVVLVD